MRRASAGTAGLRAPFVCLLLAACTSNPYFIGAGCPDAKDATVPCGGAGASGAGGSAGSSSDLSFAVDLDQSGASHLKSELQLTSGSVDAALRFRGETATANDWPSDQGALLVKSVAPPVPEREAPFTDGTRAVGFGSNAATYVAQSAEPGAVDSDDFAIELVLRGVRGSSVLGKRDDRAGWSVGFTLDGALTLALTDERGTRQISSQPLTSRAWYHCLFWVSRSAGGRAYCNGRAGADQDLSALGSLGSASPLVVGGGAPESNEGSELAHFSLFRAPRGGLEAASAWDSVSRQRFAQLTGVSPRVARGSLLPQPGLRSSPAFLDLQRGVSASRQLFLVGEDWPRVTCRADANGVRDCGYLSEPQRTRWLAATAEEWSAGELSVLTGAANFADGERRMAGLVPSTAQGPHTLSVTGQYGGARQALSFFARAEQGQLLGVTVSGHDQAIFDVATGSVVLAPGGMQASSEAWGNGLFRCALSFEPDPGPATYELELLASADAQPFAGDGSSTWLYVAGLQLDVGAAYAGSLLASASQAADQLSFVGDDGNLPLQSQLVVERLRVLLPEGPRLTDQAILNFNRGGEFNNQVQLYLTGDTAELKFWGLREGATHWAFTHPLSPSDGRRHQVEASWGADFATLVVDGTSSTKGALLANDPPFALDRIDVSYSSNSSGSLEGLVAGIEIADH